MLHELALSKFVRVQMRFCIDVLPLDGSTTTFQALLIVVTFPAFLISVIIMIFLKIKITNNYYFRRYMLFPILKYVRPKIFFFIIKNKKNLCIIKLLSV